MSPLYDQIGDRYDTTRKPDPYLASRLLHYLGVVEGKRFLDIGCGTGNYTIFLSRQGVNITGLDISTQMLAEARRKAPGIKWIHCNVESLPFEKAQFDGAIATLTIHHWPDLNRGFQEAARVIRNGNLILFTSLPVQMKGYWLVEYFPEMMARSGAQMPSREALEEAFKSAGLYIEAEEKYFVKPDLEDLFLYSGKHDPQSYLQAERRAGISSFRKLCPEKELKEGLAKLRNDVESGKILRIMKDYENDRGDYLFFKLTG